ncbi:MAG TPA: hypothetical protein VGV37_16595 [Aliidongia sp.]|uniref:hypothetical protein n=1 Tax=Aliidongia sp. TaxID=1914230 RepID=UPI002DDC93F3|nr:hypothetical protein [Aliidongia sp.]HEV2676145.1 hypothetical protein [Aliidongia sp.]
MSTTAISAATIVALYDTRDDAIRGADAVSAARIPGAVVDQIDPGDGAVAALKPLGLTRDAADRCLEYLVGGRTLVIIRADPLQASSIEAILRTRGAGEVAILTGDRTEGDAPDSALPPSVRSTAAQTGRPHGHRDPSA